MTQEAVADFPLFPLGMVALPEELVPLHIFEERYKAMMNVCLRERREFGIVWLSDEELLERGCACTIDRVLELLDDGRMNLVAKGTRPFRVVERRSDLPYPAASVEFLADRDEPVDPGLLVEARTAYAELVLRATEQTVAGDELERMSAYSMAARVEIGLEAKQALLELRSENARLGLVARLFRAATRRLEFVGRAQARARSNGKVRFA